MFSNRLFNMFLAIAILILIAMRSLGLAAHPITAASGTFVSTSTTIISEMEDKYNTITELNSTVTYTGSLEGNSTVYGTLIVHQDGSGSFRGVETFTGTVNGIPGTLTFELVGNSDLYQSIQITNSITNGTGQLANLQGLLSKAGIIKDNGPVGTYTTQITNP
jgi:uncharacterized protein DUF3224